MSGQRSALGIASVVLACGVGTAQSTTLVSVTSGGAPIGFAVGARAFAGGGDELMFITAAPDVVAGDTNGLLDLFVRELSTGTFECISRGIGGAPANGMVVGSADMTTDGRFVVFASEASNVVAGDSNARVDVFLRDRTSGTVELISATPGGAFGNGDSVEPVISSDGRYVAFSSAATDLVSSDTNAASDVFVRDRTSATTVRISVSSSSVQANGPSSAPAISGDGNFVSWSSTATNLVASDSNGAGQDVFLRNRPVSTTQLVSIDPAGAQFAGDSSASRLSFDGRYIAFERYAVVSGSLPGIYARDRVSAVTTCVSLTSGSAPAAAILGSITPDGRYVSFASNDADLVMGDTNGLMDTFVCDRTSGLISRVSVSSTGQEGVGGQSSAGELSDDGRYVLFDSIALGLVPEQQNNEQDVYLRDRLQSWFIDGDLDGYGDDTTAVIDLNMPPGHMGRGGDCDDTDPNVNPGVVEVLGNAIDDDCDGWSDEGFAYCTSATTVHGCVPSFDGTGTPSATANSGFTLQLSAAPGMVNGMVFFGLGPASIPYNAVSTRCVQSPLQRTGATFSGGHAFQCDGTLVLDWCAYMASHPAALGSPRVVGTTYYAQGWFRDGGLDKLSNAFQFTLLP